MRRDAKASSAGSISDGGRSRLALLSIAALVCLVLVTVATASASKQVIDYFGTASGSGTLGGQFNDPRDIAVNSTGAGPADAGDIYVADAANHRIQRFDKEGKFISTWGADVIQAGKPGDVAGTNPFEICTTSADCKAGAASGGNGEASGNGALDNPQSVAVDADTGSVYVSDRDNFRVNQYDGAGSFIASFGFDVDATEAATTYEVCPAANVCKTGIAGSEVGQVGFTGEGGTLGIAVSPPDGNAATGTVFLADSQNQRVNTYNLDGSSPSSFGSSANFGAAQPRKIAVDSRGIVYASDSNNSASNGSDEIDRYDSLDANGGGTVFLASIPAPLNETQKITFTGFVNGNQFTLTCPNGSTTSPIAYAAAATRNTNILNGLNAKCGAGSFAASSSGTSTMITFQGAFAATNVPTTICTRLTGSGTCTVSQEVNGHGGPLPRGDAGSATSGLSVDPDVDGAGSDEDVLYVLRDPASGSTVVQQFGPLNEPGLVGPPNAVDDVHGNSAGFGAVQGLGLDDSSGRLFVSATGPLSGEGGAQLGEGHRVYMLGDPIPAPIVTMDPITTKTDTTATFSGTVDPNGGIGVACKFQYSTNQIGWTDVADPDCSSLAPIGGPQAISQVVTGLVPNTQYFVRLAVTRILDPASTVTSPGVKSFETDSVPPVVTDVGAVQITDTSARIVGTIDPRNSNTGYVFQYGTTPALGSSTAPLAIGGDSTPITVSQVIGGLKPTTTYYFKLVATNDFGITPSVTGTFTTRADPLPLPEDRRYEMVTPPDKNYTHAYATGPLTPPVQVSASVDGEAVAFCTRGLFGDPPGNMYGFCAPYISRRAQEGWQTTNPFPQVCHMSQAYNGTEPPLLDVYLAPDFTRYFMRRGETDGCPLIPPLDPAAPLIPNGIAYNFYMGDLNPEPNAYQLLSSSPLPASASRSYKGASDDFSHIVYGSNVNQTLEPDSPAPGDFSKPYLWIQEGESGCAEPGGCLTLLSKDTGNTPFTTDARLPEITGPISSAVLDPFAVSSDGERVYFQAPDFSRCTNAECQLYMRESATTTYDVSASECTVDCGSAQTKADKFLSATESGDKAFFMSCAKLTDGSSSEGTCTTPTGNFTAADGSKLYRWNRNAAPGNRLVDLTADNEPGDGTQPDFRGLVGHSEDGEIAYFVAAGQIVSGEPTFPTSGVTEETGLKLYRWRWNGDSPRVDYLGPYHEIIGGLASDYNLFLQHRQVTPDGKYLLIYTKLAYDPAADRDAHADIYRWDESGGWTCISCQLPGTPSAGHVDLSDHMPISSLPALENAEPRVFMSDDGQRIFFGTPDALVTGDVNGEAGCPVFETVRSIPILSCFDAYEWHDGTVSLLSSGTSTEPVRLIGSTRSGRDVFFFSHQRLVGWDFDNSSDIYDARLGGGFPEPPAQPPACEGAEQCRGSGTVAPDTAGAGSAVFQGPGNPQTATPEPRRCPKGKRRVRSKGKLRCVAKQRNRNRVANRDRRVGR